MNVLSKVYQISTQRKYRLVEFHCGMVQSPDKKGDRIA